MRTSPMADGFGRIIYISTRNTAPSGGVKVLFQHVRALNELGFDACIGHPVQGYRPDWFESDVPIVHHLSGFRVTRDDVVVIPETGRNTMRLFREAPCRKLVFCQNQFGIHQGLGTTKHWRDSHIDGAFACSAVVAGWVERLMGFVPVPVIGPALEEVFFEAAGNRRLQIAYMPRKRPEDVMQLKTLLGLLYPEHAQVPWVPIDGMSVEEVARVLGGSAVFLSLSRREGLGLPPLEAMAAGALVAGFHGIGGLDYAEPGNGFWAAEEDLLDCADQLGAALHCYLEDGQEATSRRLAGRAAARRYGADTMRSALEDYFGRFRGGS